MQHLNVEAAKSAQALGAPSPAPTTLYSTMLKSGTVILVAAFVLLTMWGLSYYLYKFYKKTDAPIKSASFAAEDVVRAAPLVPGTIVDVSSDKTVDAILSGQFGPCVVMIYAEWCVHCKNMMPAFESAAKSSSVPFVRVTGPQTPVSCTKYAVAGYPTIFGVGTVLGSPRRFAGQRTPDSLHEFAKALAQQSQPMASSLPEVEVYTAPVVPTPSPAAPSLAPLSASDGEVRI